MAEQQNQPGYDQGRVPLDQRLLSMVFHNRLCIADTSTNSRNVAKRKVREC